MKSFPLSKTAIGLLLLAFSSTNVVAQLPEISQPFFYVPPDVNLKCTDEGVQEQCFPCELGMPGFKNKPHRYRREIRDMPQDQWDAFVFAMWEMKTLSMEEGQKKYGRAFKTYDYFPVMHAAVTQTLEGDQGHYSAVFIGFHAMFALMMEESLLAIAQRSGLKLDGLPYWFTADDPVTLFPRVGRPGCVPTLGKRVTGWSSLLVHSRRSCNSFSKGGNTPRPWGELCHQ